ncbi:hypothetical protein ABG067_006568 [Albugo candida]
MRLFTQTISNYLRTCSKTTASDHKYGNEMPSWVPLSPVRFILGPKCIEESQLRLGLFIEEQNQKGNPSHRINLAGFSQGSAMFIFTDLQYPHKLGGALVLSGYLPKREAFQMSQASKDVPILMCHGEMDRVV